MDTSKYYLPIKSANLAHYFSKGCVCPAKYIRNRNEDIQILFDNFLLLSKTPFTSETNCALELILVPNVDEVLKISENFLLLKKPIPISRVIKVLFEDEKQKTATLFNINSGAAYLPNSLVVVEQNTTKSVTNELENIGMANSNTEDWANMLEKFDRLMGGFSLMKLGGAEWQNYPVNYFNALSIINSLIKEEIINQSVEVGKNYDWAIIDTPKHDFLQKMIYSKIRKEDVLSCARKENKKLSESNGKFQLDKIDPHSNTFLLAILASYGEGTRLTTDNFISDLLSGEFPEKRKEGLSLIFGINKGYESFRNGYRTSNFDVSVKFELDSQLDYYTIESIYQYVFNNNISNSIFPYLDKWCPKLNDAVSIEGFETYQVLDKTVIYKKKEVDKVPSGDFFQILFQDTSRLIFYEKISSEIHKWIPAFISSKYTRESINYFSNILEKDFELYTRQVYQKVQEFISKDFESKLIRGIKVSESKMSELEQVIQTQNAKITQLELQIAALNSDVSSEFSNTRVENEYINKNNDAQLSSRDPNSQFIREVELKKLGFKRLKEEGVKAGIPLHFVSDYLNDKVSKARLIRHILQIEYMPGE